MLANTFYRCNIGIKFNIVGNTSISDFDIEFTIVGDESPMRNDSIVKDETLYKVTEIIVVTTDDESDNGEYYLQVTVTKI